MLVIAGFHRSGTSLLAELLHRGGLFVGEELLGALPSNPYGHFEDREVVDLHDAVLADNGVNWQITEPFVPRVEPDHWERLRDFVARRAAAHRRWGFKDPRVCLFLELWNHVASDMRVVVTYRSPAECVWSLERRQSDDLVEGRGPAGHHRRFWQEPDHGLRLWLCYNRQLVEFVTAHPWDTYLVDFDSLRRGFPILAELNEAFDLDLDEVPTQAVYDRRAPSRRPAPQPIHDRRLVAELAEVWGQLDRLRTASQRGAA